MKFLFGTSERAAFYQHTLAIPIAWGNLGGGKLNDWAILRLRTCVGARPDVGWMELGSRASLRAGTTVYALGFAGDTERGELTMGRGRVEGLERSSGTWYYSAPITDGMSGGPVIVEEGGFVRLIGINGYGRHKDGKLDRKIYETFSKENGNLFIDVWPILTRSDIVRVLEEDREGVPNGWKSTLRPTAGAPSP